MVFPGRFSTGCKRCRQRKVKCDEGRPSCRRCHIYGQPCPGYADQFHFRFDKSASKQEDPSPPQRRRDRPQAAPLPQRQDRNQPIVRAAGNVGPLPIMPSVEVSYDDISICYFVRRFVTPDENDYLPGHLSFLPSLYNHGRHGLLESATLSVAQMAVYNQFGGDKFRLQSYQNYGRAVRTLRKTFESETEVTDDRVLAAVLLLCAYKDIAEEGWGDPSEHASGLFYLLERRGVEQLFTNTGFELFLLALLKLQVHAFLHQDNRYCDPGGLVALLSVFDPMMRAMGLMTKTIQLRQSLLSCVGSQGQSHESDQYPSQSEDEIDQSTLRACFESLEQFDTWDSEAESYWKTTFGSRSTPAALGELATGATYYDPKTACIIILVRSARMILLLSILEYYDAIRVSSGSADTWKVGNQAAWMDCIPILEHNIRLTIDDMLYCVPLAMGDRGPDGGPMPTPQDGAAALVVFQPVKLVTYCPYATPEQRKCSQEILNRMKTAVGVRSAISWEEQAPLIASAPQRPGTLGLIRAMTMLATTDPPASSC